MRFGRKKAEAAEAPVAAATEQQREDGEGKMNEREMETTASPRSGGSPSAAASSPSASSRRSASATPRSSRVHRTVSAEPLHEHDRTGLRVRPLSEARVAELRRTFTEYDRNQSGLMELSEISLLLADLDYTYDDEYVSFLVRSVFSGDRSRRRQADSTLTFDEFRTFMHVFFVCDEAADAALRAYLDSHGYEEPTDEDMRTLRSLLRFRPHDTSFDLALVRERLGEPPSDDDDESGDEGASTAGGERAGARPGLFPPAAGEKARRPSPQSAEDRERRLARRRRLMEAEARYYQREEETDSERGGGSPRGQQQQQQKQQQQETQQPPHELCAPGGTSPSPGELSTAGGVVRLGRSSRTQMRRSASDGRREPVAVRYSAAARRGDDPSPASTSGWSGDEGGAGATTSSGHRLVHYPDSLFDTAGPAPREEAELDADDEAFLRQSFETFLRFFDADGNGALSIDEMSQSMRALGLDPSEEQMREIMTRLDVDRSGLVEYDEFRRYYLAMFEDHVRQGLPADRVRELFEQFDEDGSGSLSYDEFRHVARRLCGDRISGAEIERLIVLADADRDGDIDLAEFVALLSGSWGRGRAGARASAGGPGAAFYRKLVRSQMPSPEEYLLSYSRLPPTFRPSRLGELASRPGARLSYRIQPRLDPAGCLSFRHFRLNPLLRALQKNPPCRAAPVPMALVNIVAEAAAKTGGRGGPAASVPSSRVAYSTLLREQMQRNARTMPRDAEVASTATAAPATSLAGTASASAASVATTTTTKDFSNMEAFVVDLVRAEGVPLPKDKYRDLIVGRRVRVALFDGNSPASNQHLASAYWLPEEEDRWRFVADDPKVGTNWNSFVVKTDLQQASLLVELCMLVRRPAPEGEAEANAVPAAVAAAAAATSTGTTTTATTVRPADDVPAADRNRLVEKPNDQLLEVSCGFCTLEVVLPELAARDKAQTVRLEVRGGTAAAQAAIRRQDILARRRGWRRVAKLFKAAPNPTMTLRVRPRRAIAKRRLRTLVQYLPPGVVCAVSAVKVLRLFLEVLADRVLLPSQPLREGLVQDAEISAFLRLADMPDALQALAEVWEEKRKALPLRSRRDEANGASSALAKEHFRRAVAEAWPVLAGHSLPPLCVGVNEAERLALFRGAMRTDPLRALAGDAMVSRKERGHTTVAGIEDPGVMFSERMLHKPFNTREVAFDHARHSERVAWVVQGAARPPSGATVATARTETSTTLSRSGFSTPGGGGGTARSALRFSRYEQAVAAASPRRAEGRGGVNASW